jgi:outer membrane protein assembly factor BamA/autotransporter translocation and assembly factor TamB
MVLANVDASLQADAEEARLQSLEAGLAGGTVSAAGDLAFDTNLVDLRLDWNDIDVEALMRALQVAGPPPASLATGSASIRGAGPDIGGWAVDARTRLATRPRARGQLAVAGDTALRLGSGRWELEADGVVERVPVRAMLGGRLDAQRFASSTLSGTVAATGVDIPSVLGSLRDAGMVDAPPDAVTAGRVDAESSLGGTLAAPQMRITAKAAELSAGGVSNISADVTAAGSLRQMAVDARVRQQGANEILAAGTVWPADARLDIRVTGTLRDARALVQDVPFDGAVALDLQVAGPLASPTAKGSLTATDATYQEVRLGQLDVTVQAGRDAAHLELTAPELSTRATADVSLTGERRAAIDLRVDDADLQRLLRDLETPVPVTGRVSLSARAEGALDDWRLGSLSTGTPERSSLTAQLEVSRLEARVADLPVQIASPVRMSYGGGVSDVASLEAVIGGTRLSVTGRLPVSESAPAVPAADALRAQLVGDAAQVLEAVRATRLADISDLTARGSVAILARVTGTAGRPVVAADLEVANGQLIVMDLPPVRITELRATVANGWIESFNVSGEWQQSRFAADASVPLRLFRDYLPQAVVDALPAASGPARLEAEAASITPMVLSPFLDPDSLAQIGGGIDASLRLETTSLDPADLRGEARLDRLDLEIAGLPVGQREPTRIAFENGVARVVSWDWTGQGATLDVQGEIGLRDQQAAILAAGQFDLRLLGPFVRTAGLSVAGTLAPRISVFGSLTDPRFDGEAVVTGGEIRLRDPRLIVTDLEASAVLSPEQARITRLSGVVNGGTLSGGGDLRYGPGVSPSARLAGTITGMGLELPEGLRSELNADLAVALQQEAPPAGLQSEGGTVSGSVTGTVTIVRSAYRDPIAVVGGLLSALRTERLVAAQTAPDSLAARLALDVRLVTDNDIVVDNNLARAQLGGDLRVIGTAAAPSLAGRGILREGGQLFLGRNVYTIESGTIDFIDPVTIVPELDVVATTRAGGEDIEITFRGTSDNLDVGLRSTSDPELGEADIASLLLTGRRLEAVEGAEGDIVREQVVGYLSGDLFGIAGRTVGLDTIRFGGPDTSTLRRDSAAVAAEADPTSRLTFGKAIGNDLEVTYSQSLRDGDAQTWIIDYRPLSQLNLRLVSDDDNMRAYEFRHDLSVGGGPERRARVENEAGDIRVVDVTITIDGGISEARLRQVLRLEPGDSFDFLEWQSDRDRLEELLHRVGRLQARINARRQPRDDGVALIYDIAAGPATRTVVTGYTLAAETLRELEEAWAQSVVDDFLKEEADAIVRAALAADGFLEPQLSIELLPGDPPSPPGTSARQDPKTLQIAIDPGARATGRRVTIDAGADAALARELEQWLRERGLDSVWQDPDEIQDALTAELRARGHIGGRATAGTPRIEGNAAVLPIAVEAGPVFVIGDVRFTGASRIPEERLRQVAELPADSPYQPAAVDEARRRVDTQYRSEGFPAARITVDPVVDRDARRVSIVFAVVEGPRQVLRDVTVLGNRGIDTDVITRALDLQMGAPLRGDAWLQARARLFDTGLFRRVDVTVEPMEPGADAGERPARLHVVVEEWPALRVRYGLQVSEERPEDSLEGRDLRPGFSADVTRRTLFGRAVSVGAAAEYQRRERLVRLYMNSPTTLGLPVESLLSVERSHLRFNDDEFITDMSAVAWEQRMKLGAPLQLSYAYRFARDHTFMAEPPDDPFFPVFDVTANIARLTGSVVLDTRDDPYETTRGLLASSSLDLSARALASDRAFVRNVSQGYYFRSWRGSTFASAARLGIITPRGGQELLPSELFRTGGARTVRGVAEDSIGPVNIFDEVGGRAELVLNQEVRVPLYRWFRGVGFIDAGNVFPQLRDIDFGQLVSSYGAGLRVATPFALFRIDYGRVWTNRSDVRSSAWTFGIGHTF